MTHFALEGKSEQLMIFEATANDFPVRLILDTGAAATLIAKNSVGRLAIPTPSETVPGYGAGGAIELEVANLTHMTLCDKRVDDCAVYVSDQVDMVAEHMGLQLDGVAGYPLFSDSTLEIDFQTSKFALSDTRVTRGVPITIGEVSPLIITQGWIDNEPATFAIDTGASVTTLSMEMAERFSEMLVPSDKLAGAGGEIDSFLLPEIEVRIGDASARLTAARASSFVDSLSEAINTKLDVVLGLDWLRQFRISFDYVDRMARFE